MTFAPGKAISGMLALVAAALSPSPLSAQERHFYVCSVLASAERTFIITSVFAAGPGEAARLRAAFARWLLTYDPPFRVDEAAVDCAGDARISTASWLLARRTNENSLYRIIEVRFPG